MSEIESPIKEAAGLADHASAKPYGDSEAVLQHKAELRVPAWEAIQRHWLTVLLPTLVLLGVGVYIGLARSPVYSSEARLAVGSVDVDPTALAAFASATQSLASAYSRAVGAQSVINPVAKRLHMRPADVLSHVSSSPVPDSPVIRIIGTAQNGKLAVELAAATSDALLAYTTTLNRTTEDSGRLLADYRTVSERISREQRQADSLGRKDPQSPALTGIQAQLATDTLQARSLDARFQASQRGRGSARLVGRLSEASSPSSDRQQKLALLGLAGALAGLLVGIALATLRASARARRSLLG